MIGELSYVQFGLLCVFSFGFMALAIYIKADADDKKAAWKKSQRSGAEMKGVVDSPQRSAASRYSHEWESTYDEAC